jgi:divalent metal cation (Fe/Co/Zn/Cd) transporter
LILGVLAILVGTFAFLIDAVQSPVKLRLEQGAIYLGVVAFGASFIIAAWGLATGASGGSARPVVTAEVTTSKADGTTTITARTNRDAVRRSKALIADGNHARADAYVSLAVIASAAVVAIGVPTADPLIGLGITIVILRITWQSWRTVRGHDHQH